MLIMTQNSIEIGTWGQAKCRWEVVFPAIMILFGLPLKFISTIGHHKELTVMETATYIIIKLLHASLYWHRDFD